MVWLEVSYKRPDGRVGVTYVAAETEEEAEKAISEKVEALGVAVTNVTDVSGPRWWNAMGGTESVFTAWPSYRPDASNPDAKFTVGNTFHIECSPGENYYVSGALWYVWSDGPPTEQDLVDAITRDTGINFPMNDSEWKWREEW